MHHYHHHYPARRLIESAVEAVMEEEVRRRQALGAVEAVGAVRVEVVAVVVAVRDTYRSIL